MSKQCEKELVEINVESLNDLQLEAVQAPFSSPLLVLAGPGTGKTRVIVERIKNMVKNGIKPSEILCLTFSEKATLEMQERLEKEIDTSDLKIKTFHSFAYEILDENILESGIGIGGGIISRASELVWAMNNIDKFNFKNIELGNNPFKILESMIDGIMTFKNELVSPEELGKFLKNKLKDEKITKDPEKLAELESITRFSKNVYKPTKIFAKE